MSKAKEDTPVDEQRSTFYSTKNAKQHWKSDAMGGQDLWGPTPTVVGTQKGKSHGGYRNQ